MNPLSSECSEYDLLTLHTQPAINNISQFRDCIDRLCFEKLAAAYMKLRSEAPRRHKHCEKYFVGHKGMPGGVRKSNRREEHLAMALWNDFDRLGVVNHAKISSLQLLDYQFPLKTQQEDAYIGKVDLFAAIDDIAPCVIELKIDSDNNPGDTPLRAFLEALAYCAIVEANIGDIAREVKSRKGCGVNFDNQQPHLMVMAPESYWKKYKQHPKAVGWPTMLQKLADKIAHRIGVQSHFVALCNAEFSMGNKYLKPTLTDKCTVKSAL